MHSFNHYTSVHVKSMHINAKYWLLEHFERDKLMLPGQDLRAIIGWFRDRRNSSGEWCAEPTFQSALKVNVLHQYFLHVLMRNDWMNAFVQEKVKLKYMWKGVQSFRPAKVKSRPYQVMYVVMITPLDITVGRTQILPTTELNNLPLLINEYCA